MAGEFITQSLQISEVLLRHRCSLLTLVWSVGEFVDLWRDTVEATLRALNYPVQRRIDRSILLNYSFWVDGLQNNSLRLGAHICCDESLYVTLRS